MEESIIDPEENSGEEEGEILKENQYSRTYLIMHRIRYWTGEEKPKKEIEAKEDKMGEGPFHFNSLIDRKEEDENRNSHPGLLGQKAEEGEDDGQGAIIEIKNDRKEQEGSGEKGDDRRGPEYRFGVDEMDCKEESAYEDDVITIGKQTSDDFHKEEDVEDVN